MATSMLMNLEFMGLYGLFFFCVVNEYPVKTGPLRSVIGRPNLLGIPLSCFYSR